MAGRHCPAAGRNRAEASQPGTALSGTGRSFSDLPPQHSDCFPITPSARNFRPSGRGAALALQGPKAAAHTHHDDW